MSLSDDEQIVTTPYDTGMKFETLREGDVKANTIYKEETGTEESHLSVFLEVTGAGYENERAGVDIVTVLDVNDSMKGEKLETLKGVMRLLIDKLSSADRLSIVTVSNDPQKLCGLRQISIVSRGEIETLVSGLETYPGKDIYGGLDMAFKLINDRNYGIRRPAAVLLMSDGDHVEVPTNYVSFQTLPVYTIGLGDDRSSMVLNAIAKRSDGGIYCPINVRNTSPGNLTSAFSKCLTKLFTIVVNDLKLTFKRAESMVKIVNVCVGTYSCSYIPFTTYDDHVIVPYGDLVANETCKVKVGFLLPRVATPQHCDLLNVSYSCRIKGEVFYSSRRLVSVTRKMDNLGMSFGNKRLLSVGGNYTTNENINFQKVDDVPGELDLVDSRNTKSIISSEPNTTNIEEIQSSDGQVDNADFNQSQGILVKVSDSKISFKHLKQAINSSVKPVRGIISGSVGKYIGFQTKEGESSDLARSQNVKASDDNIRLTYDQINVVDDILQNVETIPSFMINLKGGNINEKPLEGEPAEIQDEQSEGNDESNDNQVEQSEGNDRHHDYVDQYTGFQASKGEMDDQDRSQNITALGDHIRLNFDSVKAVEDILQNVENTPSCVTNLEGRNIVNDKLLGGEQAEPQVEPSEAHGDSNDHVEYASDRIKQAFESIQIIRGILNDYVDQYIGFQASEGKMDDQDRSKNIKALGDYIRLTFDSVKAIEDILQNVESIPSCVINLEGGNVNDDKPLEGEKAETQVELSEEHEESNDQVGHVSDHIKQAFGSVQIIRDILSDYVKQHAAFEDVNGHSNDDPVRSSNVKALGDHLQRAFHSVEAIEGVLVQSG
ncbi:uncharacterized protein LOC141656478 [Silene latifolia]|uniref:uncharacterized protein LOC141656478 n=1 Tax=Silene latifolia TaxID=37657 RepID=UPI003D78AECC